MCGEAWIILMCHPCPVFFLFLCLSLSRSVAAVFVWPGFRGWSARFWESVLCVLADGGTYRRKASANRLQWREKDLLCLIFWCFSLCFFLHWFVEVSVDAWSIRCETWPVAPQVTALQMIIRSFSKDANRWVLLGPCLATASCKHTVRYHSLFSASHLDPLLFYPC